MKTILILTASTGGGHNQAANALREIYIKNGYQVETLDIFKDSNEKLDTIMVEGYTFLATKMPKTYGDLYWLSNQKVVNKPLCDAIARRTWRSLSRNIQQIHPSLILSTHPFAVEIVAKIKRHTRLQCPYLAVVTDFIAHQTYLSPAVDGYIVGSEWTKKDLLHKGIQADRIHALGIPTRSEFYEPLPQHDIAEPIQILAMAGSLGLKEMADCLDAIMDNKATKVTAVCGNNKTLYKTLSLQFQDEIQSERLTLYGFTKNIRNLMDTHDCIMTKPGGLTTTESILRQIPMIIPFMIPGQETENTEFLVDEGMAIRVDSAKDLAEQVDQLARYPHRLPLMRARMKAVADTYSPASIYSLSESLIQRKSEKVVIFSAGFGAGHQMVTNAISEEFHSRYQTASIKEIDLMNWLMPQLSQSIYDGYRYFVKNYESLYNRFYAQKEDDDSASVLLAKLMQKKTSKLVAKETPTLLISTFPICTQVLGAWKQKSGSEIPLVTVITDVTSASEWLHPAVTHYMVASESVEQELIEKGVNKANISVTGIPVRRAFQLQHKRKVRPVHSPLRLLVMGGGFGLLPEDQTLYRWLQDDPSIDATIITGHNHGAYQTLKDHYPRLRVKGFVHEIAEEMKQADLLLTKPGGITLFEAIHVEIPILAYRPSLGQEQKNAHFIEKTGIGQSVFTTGEILRAIDSYKSNQTIYQARSQMASIHTELSDTSKEIWQQLLEERFNG
ncbi:hypothetical protein SANA_27390 [Gottschalkiaceae bacterium SANA]|nr:hypothetical protein SANA_27390 [Gottschalkiaceae bacterium SANA]